VPEIESVLGVVAEVGVVDVYRETHPHWSTDAVAISAVALAVAGDGSSAGIGLVAPVPLDGGVVEVPDAVDACCGVAVVEVPASGSVVGDIASSAGDDSADRAFDAAAEVSVNPHVLEEEIVSVDVGDDAVGVVVIDRCAAVAGSWVGGISEEDALRMASYFEAFDVHILRAL